MSEQERLDRLRAKERQEAKLAQERSEALAFKRDQLKQEDRKAKELREAEKRDMRELRELEERDKLQQHGLSVQRFERNIAEPAQSTDALKLSQAIRFVPKFPDDDDMTDFLKNLKKTMLVHNFLNRRGLNLSIPN